VLATVALSPVASFGIHDALDVIGVAKDVVIWIAKAWNIIEGQVEYADVPFPLLDKTERKLFGKIDLINSKLNQLSAQVEAVGTNTISMMLNNLPERIRLELRLNDLLNYHDLVGNSFQTMQKYTTYRDYLEKSTLKDYADNVVSHDPSSVRGMIETIYTYVVPSGKGINDRGILQLLSKSLKVRFPRTLTPLDDVIINGYEQKMG
jgi:regulator of replication initiation timing